MAIWRELEEEREEDRRDRERDNYMERGSYIEREM
jgi:hypothetical protein